MLIGCKKTEVNFSYSPTAPRAGQSVAFTNLSSSGEEWEWAFGDGSTSTLKSPTHIYKRPGSYLVVLKVDNKNSLRETKEIVVYDTVPSFVCSDSTLYIYEDYTFTASVYNPYNYNVKYLWDIYTVQRYDWETAPQSTLIDGDMTSSTLKVNFLVPTMYYVGLQVILNGDTTYVQKEFFANDRATNSVLIRTDEADYRQRIFGNKAEEPKESSYATPYLDAEQDTMQIYNGYTFRLSELQSLLPGIQGFHIANRKIYYRADGLWIANIDGAYPVQIDSKECYAMTLDMYDNRIYWANEQGVWYLPFVGSDNNKFVTVPTQLNTLEKVSQLAADETPSNF